MKLREFVSEAVRVPKNSRAGLFRWQGSCGGWNVRAICNVPVTPKIKTSCVASRILRAGCRNPPERGHSCPLQLPNQYGAYERLPGPAHCCTLLRKGMSALRLLVISALGLALSLKAAYRSGIQSFYEAKRKFRAFYVDYPEAFFK